MIAKPSSFEVKDYVLTSVQTIYIMSKFLHTTRDFWGETFKKEVGWCANLMSRCSKSRDVWYKLFGKNVYGIDLCVPQSYDKAYYRFQIKDKSGKKIVNATSTKEIKFTTEEKQLVKAICEYKKKFDGRGDDPKCASSIKELNGGRKKAKSR
jgi:hypothetical protein